MIKQKLIRERTSWSDDQERIIEQKKKDSLMLLIKISIVWAIVNTIALTGIIK